MNSIVDFLIEVRQKIVRFIGQRKGYLPNGVYYTTQEWLVNHKPQPNTSRVAYQIIHAGANVKRPYPQTVESKIHWHFEKHLEHDCSSTFAVYLPNARVYGDRGEVLTSDNYLLWDLSMDYVGGWTPHDNSLLKQGTRAPITHLPGMTANLSWGFVNVYGHWMVDVLPKLHLMQLVGVSLDAVNQFLCHSLERPFHWPSLQPFGITPDRLVTVGPTTHFQCDVLVGTSYPRARGFRMDWICQFLRDTYLPLVHPKKQKRRIYLTRKLASHRRVLNEDELFAVLEPLGFERAAPEQLSFLEGIQLFAEAEVVIGPHGSNLTNILFCNPGTKVLEFASHGRLFYWALACATHLDYYYLNGYEQYQEDFFDRPIPNQEDMLVDLNKFKQTLELAALL